METLSVPNFIKLTEEQVGKCRVESELLRAIYPNLVGLLASDISPDVFMPRSEKYAMNLVYAPSDKSFSVVAGVWQPGQTTPIHDHLTWALVGIYRGSERESIFKRVDDKRDREIAKLEQISDRINETGHVTILGEAGIHRVSNPSNGPAWSIHVYGRDIGNVQRHSYDPISGEITTFTSGYCNVLRDPDTF